MERYQRTIAIAGIVSLMALTACVGSIHDASAGGPSDGPEGSAVDLGACGESNLAPTTRMPRLSHAQLANTFRDLLRLSAAPAEPSTFLADAQDTGFDNDGARLQVAPALGRAYQNLAERLAADVADAPDGVVDICDTADADCVSGLVRGFGLRAYRRPLSAEEEASFVALFARGPELVGSGDAFHDGVELTVQAMLQSPNFLYRVERSATSDAVTPLDTWEIATRLSYALWASMPDDALFAAAESGALGTPEEIAAQAERMLSDPKAETMIDDFYRQLLSLDEYDEIDRDAALNPAWENDISEDLEVEAQLFARDVVLHDRGGIRDLFTSSFTYATDRTIAIYGDDVVSDPGGEGFRRIELDPARRAGLLTQLGFLASNAYRAETDPIHRGVFLHRRVLCNDIPPPPDDVSITLPETSAELRTTRDRVTYATSGDSCQGCHSMINEPGFAFESYDAIGQFRTTDNDVAVDTTGSIAIDGQEVAFDGAVELVHAIADSESASECYTRQFFRYVHARTERSGDCDALSDFSTRLRAGDLDLRSLIVEVVTHPSFSNRADEVTR